MTKKATHRAIDSVWTLEYIINDDNTMTIISHDREDVEGYEREKELPRFKIIENDKREALNVLIQDFKQFTYIANDSEPHENHKVANVKGVFSY
jgi:hypothetical protein